jgi:hypothetical protein
MTAVCLVSAKGSPGVTTCALLLTALLPGSVLVEADPAGGDLRARLSDPTGQPLRPDVGVVSLLAAHRTVQGSADRELLAHAQQLAGGLPVLVGPGSPAQAAALAPVWPQLGSAVTAHAGLVLLDLGRLDPQHTGSWTLVDACPLTVVVTAASVAAVGHARDLLATLAARGRTLAARAGVLVIGSEADRRQVSEAFGAGWTGRLPHDPDAARQLLAGLWSARLDRSPLLTVGRRLAAELHALLPTAPEVTAPAPDAALPYPVEPTAAGVSS